MLTGLMSDFTIKKGMMEFTKLKNNSTSTYICTNIGLQVPQAHCSTECIHVCVLNLNVTALYYCTSTPLIIFILNVFHFII